MTPDRRTPRRIALGAALVAVAVAGCGGTPAESDATKVTRAIERYLDAQVAGDGAAACALLSPAGKRQLMSVVAAASQGLATQPSCEDAVGLVRAAAGTELVDALGRARVEHVVVDGDRATADVVDGAALPRRRVTLVQTSAGWRISGVPGLPR